MPTPGAFQDRCIQFSGTIVKLVSQLEKNKTSNIIADQLLRSGMSVGANAHEARSAESRADFIHKMAIALKESREAQYWLALVRVIGIVEENVLSPLVRESNEITAILAQSVITAKKNEAK